MYLFLLYKSVAVLYVYRTVQTQQSFGSFYFPPRAFISPPSSGLCLSIDLCRAGVSRSFMTLSYPYLYRSLVHRLPDANLTLLVGSSFRYASCQMVLAYQTQTGDRCIGRFCGCLHTNKPLITSQLQQLSYIQKTIPTCSRI